MLSLINRRKIRLARKMKFWRRRKADMSRPRLCVFRSAKHIQLQLIDDKTGSVLVSASSSEKGFDFKGNGLATAATVGANVASRAASKGIKEVVFDRNGYIYHGRVAAAAKSAREAGLSF
jgi:large subunit ribosomal protein L18